ncbi:DUF6685 family protein [Burkholderia contaminans]|uniref:Uncharacterized protein n=1 Tax=Burkholderia contaminans TaxID=488447 RepID=A0A6P2ZUI9_9BURK|nr:DUF6685 family protein [Burkholderia contaminans]VWD38587.1 hypothetical protein BCO71033_04426 [Burkholderia contaminans]
MTDVTAQRKWSSGVSGAAEIPWAVARPDLWPWWRRQLSRPPAVDRARILAWIDLQKRLRAIDQGSLPKQLGVRGEGVFGNSIRHVEWLDSWDGAPFEICGLVRTTSGLRRSRLACPEGRLTQRSGIDGFEFDISDIEGIGNSKSSDRCFASVKAFGLDFATYDKASVDVAGLSRMLSHREVRILRRDPGDAVGVRLWDGRLFLYNAGGSHHFAGAHYIASEIKMCVPLRARLEVIELNVPAVRWLLARFTPISIPRDTANAASRLVAQVLGSSYTLPIPGGLARATELLLVPEVGEASPLVVEQFECSGMPRINRWFEELIRAQQEHRAALTRRFPTAFPVDIQAPRVV